MIEKKIDGELNSDLKKRDNQGNICLECVKKNGENVRCFTCDELMKILNEDKVEN